MKTIKENITSKYVVNKSIFITKLFKVNNIDEIKNILNDIKKEYKDATHHCYAYIIEEVKKSSDDNEPSGTAGTPILDVLSKNNLNYILCVVIRYFGGIKLGAGGLIRAYSTSVSNALKESEILELTKGYNIEFITTYDKQKNIDYLLDKYNYTKEYKDNIIYNVDCDLELLEILKINNIDYNIKKNIYITK